MASIQKTGRLLVPNATYWQDISNSETADFQDFRSFWTISEIGTHSAW
jgi:hypothetical protein